MRLARLVLAEAGADGAERVERMARLPACADRAGNGKRLLAASDRITGEAAQHQQLALGGDDAGPFGVGGSAGNVATASR